MFRATLACAIVVASLHAVRADDDPLAEFAKRYAAQEARYEEAEEHAKSDQERKEVFDSLHPVNAFVGDLVALEASHRGQPAGISALYSLMRNAIGVGLPQTPASQGRVKAIQIVREHYLDHPDLDLLLVHFVSGAFTPEAEGLLTEAMSSPHAQVRVAARYQLARFLVMKAELAEIFGPNSTAPTSTVETHPAVVERRRLLRARVKELAIDPTSERKRAVSLLEAIVADYPDAVQIFPKLKGPGSIEVGRPSSEELKLHGRPYAKLASAMLFELQHLQNGQVAPEITGKDIDGIEFKLSDYRGRVVLLQFSANWCGPCKAMYPDIRKLVAELEEEPFSMLAVMADKKVSTVIDDTKSGDIRWRTWFDGDPGPIATEWNVQSWPTVYLIDHKGVIVERDYVRDYETLRKAVDKLLTAQKADPLAAEQVRTHPVPKLPNFARD
ncbi:MAG TPA: TlpA disulfide reductase family protein [Pirellulales bacterium]|jgi:thiol-disulfide isomerase/thioredoxin|nr:TlpA disulfide reductase family protein [Pirellulales bacterium]